MVFRGGSHGFACGQAIWLLLLSLSWLAESVRHITSHSLSSVELLSVSGDLCGLSSIELQWRVSGMGCSHGLEVISPSLVHIVVLILDQANALRL